MDERGWDECDFIFVSGDAYVDHPSFAAALICRLLEAEGYRVGIIAQPDWKVTGYNAGASISLTDNSPTSPPYTALGRPALAFLAGAGNMDSMVSHYTAAKRKRSTDAYSPGGKAGYRPDRALIKYVEGIRNAYKKIPVIIGGMEASLRRFAHYDYWSDTVRRSILLDSKADILVYGMGENAILEIASRLASGENIQSIKNVRGTCIRANRDSIPNFNGLVLPSYESVKGVDPESLKAYAKHFMIQKNNSDPLSGQPLLEETDSETGKNTSLHGPGKGSGTGRLVIQNPPALPLTSAEMDRIHELPFTREAHPVYEKYGGVPALNEVKFSLTASRGCFGGCSFCAIGFHQGRVIQNRSTESLVREAKLLADMKDFKGYIHDVGGPTANFFDRPCQKQKSGGFCADRECMTGKAAGNEEVVVRKAEEVSKAKKVGKAEAASKASKAGEAGKTEAVISVCPALKADHSSYLKTLATLRTADKRIKKVFIRSGIRYDYMALDSIYGDEFLETLCAHHVSGQLRVAPEHISKRVLVAMGKPVHADYETFRKRFNEVNKKQGLKQYIIPYFISGHPGSSLEDAIELALYLRGSGFVPDQVQDFYPTPGSLSTVMYRCGFDPRTGEKIHVPKEREKKLQRALLQFNKKENKALVIKALKEAGRSDLIKILGA